MDGGDIQRVRYNPNAITFRAHHPKQAEVFAALGPQSVLRCGRRWGKTTFFEDIAGAEAIRGQAIGWFTPNYKLMIPSYKRILRIIKPLVSHKNQSEGIIETETGGQVEFWTLNDEDAGRSRAYDGVIIDEASLVKKGMKDIWEKSIAPTLLDRRGWVFVAGTPKGIDSENWFYMLCEGRTPGWKEFHLPTRTNPMLNQKGVAGLKDKYPPLVYQQEYLADFVDWSGQAFFSKEKMLVDGLPIPMPQHPDAVFAVVDSATKTGQQHDGTGVIYVSVSRYQGTPLAILDWDIQQIEGASLEMWLPAVQKRLDELVALTKARLGSGGIHIEDKASGMILLQQAQRKKMKVFPIKSGLTALGKEERAIDVSGFVHQGLVKFTQPAYDKSVTYKKLTENHLLTQVLNFRVGQDEDKRADDLLDCFTYAIALGLGNTKGF